MIFESNAGSYNVQTRSKWHTRKLHICTVPKILTINIYKYYNVHIGTKRLIVSSHKTSSTKYMGGGSSFIKILLNAELWTSSSNKEYFNSLVIQCTWINISLRSELWGVSSNCCKGNKVRYKNITQREVV